MLRWPAFAVLSRCVEASMSSTQHTLVGIGLSFKLSQIPGRNAAFCCRPPTVWHRPRAVLQVLVHGMLKTLHRIARSRPAGSQRKIQAASHKRALCTLRLAPLENRKFEFSSTRQQSMPLAIAWVRRSWSDAAKPLPGLGVVPPQANPRRLQAKGLRKSPLGQSPL